MRPQPESPELDREIFHDSLQSSLRDMRFVLDEVFDVAKLWAELPALAEVVDAETAAAILEEAGKVTGDAIAPLNRSGDEEAACGPTAR